MFKKLVSNLMIGFLIITIFIVGCSSDTTYVPPSKVESTPSGETPFKTQTTTPSEPKTQPEPSKVTEFKIGETATDDQLRVTIHSVDFKKIIYYEPGYTSLPIEPVEGNEFVIIDLTIENILDDKTQTPVLTLQSSVMDQDGYSYQLASVASVALDKVYDNKDILPGMKKRGKVAYSVPENAKDLKFLFKFDVFQAKTAIFDIK